MNYSLHPEAVQDLRDAASFYREQAGNSLSQSFLAEFEQSVNILAQHPGLGLPWPPSPHHETLSVLDRLNG
jgi:plasmid stabilization system protein ParE